MWFYVTKEKLIPITFSHLGFRKLQIMFQSCVGAETIILRKPMKSDIWFSLPLFTRFGSAYNGKNITFSRFCHALNIYCLRIILFLC